MEARMHAAIVLPFYIVVALATVTPDRSPSSQVAELRLARIFGDGMVIQRNKPVVVWGWAAPRERVTVSFHGHTAVAVAAPEGRGNASLRADRARGRRTDRAARRAGR